MRQLSFCLLLLLTLLACEETNELTISEEKLVLMMSDMLLAESAINRLNRSDADSLEKLYYQQIYTIHAVDSTQFADNLKIMGADSEMSLRVYKKIEERMEGKLKDVKTLEEERKKEKEEEAKRKKEAKKKEAKDSAKNDQPTAIDSTRNRG